MSEIGENLRRVAASLPPHVRLVAVSKYHPADDIREAYACGQRVFGESHEQELARKQAVLPRDIQWHFIGHLQTNKVKAIIPYVSMIESVDSLRLMREIEKQAARAGRVVDVLLELHIAEEATKYGLAVEACRALLDGGEWRSMSHVRIRGLMMMASNVDDVRQIRGEFTAAADFFDEVKAKHFASCDSFCERSWGMSGDYKIAVECRSTIVRIGTTIFGERAY